MSTLSQFFGGGGGQFSNKLFVLTSRTFTIPPGATKVRVHAWGAGGSGASGVKTRGEISATGGGGGSYSSVVFTTVPGEIMTITIGAGAVSPSALANGNTGGATIVTYSGKTITANGGTGGNTLPLNGTVLGGFGGIATGGDLNINGGNAHVFILSGFAGGVNTSVHLAGGGGAAATPIYGTPSNTTVSYAYVSAGEGVVPLKGFGGIGVGSYSILSSFNNSTQTTGGGGTNPVNLTNGGQGKDIFGLTAGGSNELTPAGANTIMNLVGDPFLRIYGAGGDGASGVSYAEDGGPGGGGGGGASNTGNYSIGGNGGLFAGGGGSCTANSSYDGPGAPGGLGGGGGGGSVGPTSSARGGDGGNGLVILEW